ncbi:MAG: inositol monophosphatase family protein [Micrococcaceae bacterium]
MSTSSTGPHTVPAPALSTLLTVARAAARAGADVLASRPRSVLPLQRADLGAETKSSGSDWVTDFDRQAEEGVRKVITGYRPHDEIYGEEYGSTKPENPTGYRWSIDPLDGTTNFIRGVPHYCTSVAVAGPDGGWLAGAVVAPALGRIWYASRGNGAFSIAETPGADEMVGIASHPAEPQRLGGPILGRSGRLLASGFGYDPERRKFQLGILSELLTGFGDLRRIGSAALDLCMVADGTLDAYAEYGTQEYDWAAGALIAEEAGVPVRRPQWPESSSTPDWMIAGDIDRPHVELPHAPGHPYA